MTYKLKILPAALKEWEKLGATVQGQFKIKLAERLENPEEPADKLSGQDSVYKIGFRSAGYRLGYEIVGDELLVYGLADGMRVKGTFYSLLKKQT
jgi:mRNA interferase RelE/StbE